MSNKICPVALAIGALTVGACSGPRVDVVSTSPAAPTSSAPSTTPPAATRQFRGAIERIDATASVLVVDGASVSVPASATIRDTGGGALTFADLKVGDIVSIVATIGGNTITATTIVRESPPPPPTTTLTGRVAAVSGTCPALTFAVSEATVTTTAATTFSGGTCAQVVNGVHVEVTGTRQADRSLAATQVTFRH